MTEAKRIADMTLVERAEWVADTIVGRSQRAGGHKLSPMTRDDPLWRDIRSRAFAIAAPPERPEVKAATADVEGPLWSCGHHHRSRGEAMLCGKNSDNLKPTSGAVVTIVG